MHGLLPELHVLLELQHTEAIKRAVEAGLGLGCLSRITLEDAFAARQPGAARGAAARFHRGASTSSCTGEKYRSPGIERWLGAVPRSAP